MPNVITPRGGQDVSLAEPAFTASRATLIYYTLEGLNSFATTLYFYYVFFFLEQHFAFTKESNLLCAAMNGCVYVVGSWYGGRFGQKHGYTRALSLGFLLMFIALLAGAKVEAIPVQLLVLALWTIGMSFTWPALEASVSEGEPRESLPRAIGVYNLVWAGTSALAYFSGGAMLEKLGPNSLFLVPASIHLLQLILLTCFARPANGKVVEGIESTAYKSVPPIGQVSNLSSSARNSDTDYKSVLPSPTDYNPVLPARARAFLRMAWLANPFAYIAINSFIPTIPYVAKKLALSPMMTGFFCSVWLFARLLAFAGLWLWTGWHYRFRWLLTAYVAMISCFVLLLLAPNLWLVMAAQVAFGLAVGLIYYSSLFYSMDVGETKGEHGGLHEAAIGLGNFAGPALGATALHYFPAQAQSGTWSVSALLLAGLTALWLMGRKTTAQKQ